MSSHTPGKRVRAKRVRNDGGVREERGEEEADYANERADSLTDQGSGSQGATGDQVVQRGLIIERDIFRAAAMCLTVLCVLVVVRTTGMVMDYHSDILTQERDQLLNNLTLTLTRYNNVTLERDQLLNNLTLTLTNMNLERELLQNEINHLKRETADKSCSSGWQKSGDVLYYISTEQKTWEESRQQCQTMGARLVVINSQDKQDFFSGLKCWKGASHTWIGLKRGGKTWTWEDGKPLITAYWAAGYPVDQADWRCAYYWPAEGTWRNMQCSQRNTWICEKTYTS